MFVARVDVSPSHEQRVHQMQVAGQACLHQGSAAQTAACVDRSLVLHQQYQAGSVVVATDCSQQSGLAASWLWLGLAIKQKARHAPIARLTGHAQGAVAVTITGVDLGVAIEQECGDFRIGEQRRKVQRRAAFGIGSARIGAVGEQGHHRFRAAMQAIASRRKQRCQPGMATVDIDTAGDQCAQQAQVGEHRRQHDQRALVALTWIRQRVRLCTHFKFGECQFDPPITRHGVKPHGRVQADGQQQLGFDRTAGSHQRALARAVRGQLGRLHQGDQRCTAKRRNQHGPQRQRQHAHGCWQAFVKHAQTNRAQQQDQQQQGGQQTSSGGRICLRQSPPCLQRGLQRRSATSLDGFNHRQQQCWPVTPDSQTTCRHRDAGEQAGRERSSSQQLHHWPSQQHNQQSPSDQQQDQHNPRPRSEQDQQASFSAMAQRPCRACQVQRQCEQQRQQRPRGRRQQQWQQAQRKRQRKPGKRSGRARRWWACRLSHSRGSFRTRQMPAVAAASGSPTAGCWRRQQRNLRAQAAAGSASPTPARTEAASGRLAMQLAAPQSRRAAQDTRKYLPAAGSCRRDS